MEDIDEHIGHRYVPGHEREDCEWMCDVLFMSMNIWHLTAMVVGGALLIALIFGIRRLFKVMGDDSTVVRQRTDAEKQEHLRTIRELRKGR